MRSFAPPGTPALFTLLPLISVGFSGACFGFFFAWQSSTLRGLDMIDPATAIEAMQAMNASVRNPLFGAVYFGTPVVLTLAVVVMAVLRARVAAAVLGLALVLHMAGVFGVTAALNVPLNRELAAVDARAPGGDTIWQAYSTRWQSANLIRMIAAGGCLMLVAATLTPHSPEPEKIMSIPLLTFALAALLTVAMPGPTSLLAFSNGARHGLRDAGFGVAGAVLSDLVLIAAVSAGLGVLLSTSQLLFSAVKWLGVVYLAYVGLRLLFSKTAPAEASTVQVTEVRRLFSRSFLVAVTNPKGYLFFTALLPQFIDAAAPVLPQYMLLAVGFSLIDLAVLLAYAAAGRRCAGRFGPRLIARMDRVCGGIFLALAGGLAMLRRAGA